MLKKIKVQKSQPFYMALVYKKIDNLKLAKEKLNEAQTVTGMGIDTFVNSEPYKDETIPTGLRSELESVSS